MSSGFENLFLAKPLGPLGHSASSLNVPFSCAQGDGGEGTPEKFGNFSSLGDNHLRLKGKTFLSWSLQVQPPGAASTNSSSLLPSRGPAPHGDARARGRARAHTHGVSTHTPYRSRPSWPRLQGVDRFNYTWGDRKRPLKNICEDNYTTDTKPHRPGWLESHQKNG